MKRAITYTAEEAAQAMLDLLDEETNSDEHYLDEVVDYDDPHLEEVAALDPMDDADDIDLFISTADPQPLAASRSLHKKVLTRKRLVNSIDNALNESNFDKMVDPNEEEEYASVLGAKTNKKAPKISWTNVNPRSPGNNARTCWWVPDTLKSRKAKAAKKPLMALECFIPETLVERIVICTNARIGRTVARMSLSTKTNDKNCYFKVTDCIEVRALIGLMYLRGALGQNNIYHQPLWTEDFHYLFAATMSRSRFMFLQANLAFDDENTCAERWTTDRFAGFRMAFELFNNECSKHVVPSDYLCIDETLFPMRNQIAYNQYNKNKPAKYGLLIKSLNSSRNQYTYKALPYASKPNDVENAIYYLTKTEEYVKALVTLTENDVSLGGRCIAMDRLYTAVPTSQWLLEKDIAMVGTLNHNRIVLPNELKTTEGREDLSSKTFWEE